MARPSSHSSSTLEWSLRTGVAHDALLLAAIDSEASAYPWRESQFTPSTEAPCEDIGEVSRQNLVVAESVDSLIGFVVFSKVFDEGEVLNIAVRPSSQGLGIARSLLSATLEVLQSAGVKRCLLEVRESNIAARRLYESFEFHIDGVRKNYYPTNIGRENALLMSKSLLESGMPL